MERAKPAEPCSLPLPRKFQADKERFFLFSGLEAEASWKRSRWPWPKKMLRADIKPDIPIPHPGKGENSWDCGEDATYSMTCPAETPHDAVMSITGSIMKRRQRYGGIGWRPEKVGS